MRNCLYIGLITIIILLNLSIGQELYLSPSDAASPLRGNFSYRLFRADSLIKVNITVQLTNNALQFIRDNGRFIGRYRIDAAIYDGDELLMNKSLKDSAFAGVFSETNISELWYAGTLSMCIYPGKYKLFIILTDINADTRAENSTSLKIPSPEKLHIATPSFFVPENDSLILSSYIPMLWESLSIAANVYDIPENARCEVQISGPRYRTKKYLGRFSYGIPDTVMKADFSLDDMQGGEYTAKLRLLDGNGKQIAETKAKFILIQTPMSMYRFHYKELIRQLELIANPSEIDALEEADSISRDSLWENFWKVRDPTPTTKYNESKEEFFRRVRYSNDNFGTPSRAGWKSDRGRVYIMYGQPDEIERHPFEIDTYPYETWYYYSLRLTMLFVDHDGDGDYRLYETR